MLSETFWLLHAVRHSAHPWGETTSFAFVAVQASTIPTHRAGLLADDVLSSTARAMLLVWIACAQVGNLGVEDLLRPLAAYKHEKEYVDLGRHVHGRSRLPEVTHG